MPKPTRLTLPLLLFLALLPACGEDQDRYMLDDGGAGDAGDASVEQDGSLEDASVSTCGNGEIEPGETCDDGNAITESCAYGAPSCTVCNATCQDGPGTLAFCGDGTTNAGHEACDDPDSPLCTDTCELTCAAEGAVASELLSTGCYHYFESSLASYAELTAACDALGGHLASFESNAEWRTARRVLRMSEATGFIGLTAEDGIIGAWASGAPYVPGELEAGVFLEGEGSGDCASTDGYDIYFEGCEGLEGAQFLCEISTCGDGQVFGNEECDDQNTVDDDGCDSNCRLSGCGNDVVNAGEDCDDGNLEDGDACPSTCTFACGRGTGAAYATTTPEGCFVAYDAPRTYASARAFCESNGLALAQPKTAEALAALDELVFSSDHFDIGQVWVGLDDIAVNGTFVFNDGTPLAYAPWSWSRPTTADTGEDCARLEWNGQLRDVYCHEVQGVVCQATSCGNGSLDAGEACDDGDLENGDGCDANCTVSACGNRVLTEGEDCDDGNLVDGDGCPATCILPCGAGLGADRVTLTSRGCYLAYDEQVSFASASARCTDGGGTLARIDDSHENAVVRRMATGGRYGAGVWFNLTDVAEEGVYTDVSGAALGYVYFSEGEPNDTNHFENCGEMTGGGRWNDLSCFENRGYVCEIATCGNGVVDANETCDAPDAVNGDGCDINCSVTGCGNGIRTAGEACDDGNVVDGDGCESDCTFACGDDPGADAVYAHGGSCYRFIETAMTYTAAEARCAMPGGALIEIGDSAENDYLVSLHATDGFLGLRDTVTEGVFVWASGQPLTYAPWAPGEPNNSGNEDCVASNAEGGWNDVRCEVPRTFVCESPLP